MFGKLGKKYAEKISEKIGEKVGEKYGAGSTTEEATEKLGRVHGKRRGLFIGINCVGKSRVFTTDTGQQGELRGCINDVKNIKAFLTENYDFDDILVLTDDCQDRSKLPTRQNILNGFKWLRKDAKSGDSLFMHYSGHGGSVKDEDGDEADGMDETLIPLDYQRAGQIVDDEVHAVLVRDLPKGVRLTAIMDCCHSESILDLPYLYNVDGDLVITENKKADGIKMLVGAGTQMLLEGSMKNAMSSAKQGAKLLMAGGGESKDSEAQKRTEATRSTVADVLMFSGCQDSQTSADATINGEATGAMSYALITSLKKDKNMDYMHLLQSMRQALKGKYTQVPMLSAGRKLAMDHPFAI